MHETRERIVAATIELLRRYGFNGTSLKQVSVASGATIGSIYHFFPGGKEELVAAALRSAGATYLELFIAIADAATDIRRAVTDFFQGAAAVLAATDYLDLCPIGTVAGEIASSNDALRIAAAEIFDSWTTEMRSRLVSAGVTARRASDLSVFVVATLEGGFMLARTHRSPEPLLAAGRQVRHCVDDAVGPHPVVRPRRASPRV
jgi:AcrR family transcriptional regulator